MADLPADQTIRRGHLNEKGHRRIVTADRRNRNRSPSFRHYKQSMTTIMHSV